MINVIVNGAGGRMGRELTAMLGAAPDLSIAACVDIMGGEGMLPTLSAFTGEADLIIDFSNHSASGTLMEYAVSRGLAVVVATTGHSGEELSLIHAAAEKIPIFLSPNMSLGVALQVDFAKQAAAAFPNANIEIVEKHHNRKKDAPSGTALKLAREIAAVLPAATVKFGRSGFSERDPNEITVHSLRMGNIVGEHEVLITTDTQQLSIRHEAYSRAIFAEGALSAARFLVGKPAGCYSMEDLAK